MAETTVIYETRSGRRELPVRFLGKDQNFVLKTEPISRRLTANVPPRLLDLLEISAAVFCADASVSRGSLIQPRDGRTWRRDFAFEFAVRDIDFWQQSDATRALRDTIEFMTNDRVECSFIQSEAPPPVTRYMEFEQTAGSAERIDDVILFSGGLDSLAGAVQTLETTAKRVALVTHRSAPKTVRQQDLLMKAMRQAYGDRILWVPVQVNRKGRPAAESTQRSRSLLFATLGCIVGQMLGTDRIQFFENGFVSQNLPLARPITGTLATRTTHPKTLKLLESLVSQVCEKPMAVENAFQWMTKTEVVGLLARLEKSNLIAKTISCNHTFKRKAETRHCGECTQCLDRRFAIIANGLGALERRDDYEVDVLFGTRSAEDRRALAVEWVRHAQQLAVATDLEFRSKFMSELLRIVEPFGDKAAAMGLCHEMHRRHGAAVRKVLDALPDAQVVHAPAGSIAAMFGGVSRAVSAPPDHAGFDLDRSPPSRAFSGGPELQGIEVCRVENQRVSVLGLQDFSGVRARLLSCLMDVFLEDRDDGRRPRDFRTLRAGEIADRLQVSEEYVRTEVRRIRLQIGESWAEIRRGEPPKGLLVETIGKGYRLNPAVSIVSADQAG